MNFMVFEGYLGSGKTLGASIFAKYYQEKSGCALYSNYGLIGSHPFTAIEDFHKIACEQSSILVLDEAHIDLDSRSFNSNHVKFFSQVSYYLRKLRCTLIMTSPSFDDLDSRIRGVTNIVASVTKNRDYFFYNLKDIQSNRFLKRMRIKKDHAFSLSSQIFNTSSMVMPVKIEKNRDDFLVFLESLKSVSDKNRF